MTSQHSTGRLRLRRRAGRLAAALVVFLSGGTTFVSCDAQLKDALRSGAENYLYTIINEGTQLAVEAILPTDSGDSTSTP